MPADPPPRNPFPRWARRMDPLLEAAGNNHWFLLIRDRRIKQSSRWIPILAYWGSIMVLLVVAGEHILRFRMPSPTTWTILGLLYLSIVATGIFSAKRVARSIPPYVVYLAIMPRANRQALHDLWLAGCNGSGLLEASYAEQREARRRLWTLVLLLALPASSFYLAQLGTGLPQLAAMTAHFALLLACCYSHAIGGRRTAYRKLSRIIIRYWNEGAPTTYAFWKKIKIQLPLFLTTYGLIFFWFQIPLIFSASYTYFITLGTIATSIILIRALTSTPLPQPEHKRLSAEADAALGTLIREHLGADASGP